jgi:hypothetical protein
LTPVGVAHRPYNKRVSPASLDQQIKAEERLRAQLGKFAGRWVAVKDHEIVANAESAGALLKKLGSKDVDGIFEIPVKGAVCFF